MLYHTYATKSVVKLVSKLSCLSIGGLSSNDGFIEAKIVSQKKVPKFIYK